jgi:hypothetical protein
MLPLLDGGTLRFARHEKTAAEMTSGDVSNADTTGEGSPSCCLSSAESAAQSVVVST